MHLLRQLGPALVVAVVGCMPTLDRQPPCDDRGPGRERGDLFFIRDGDGPVGDGVPPGCNPTSCPLGCNDIARRCYRLKPSNFDPTSFFDSLTGDLAPSADLTFDTDSGEIKQGASVIRAAGGQGSAVGGFYWDVVSQGAGLPEIAVFGAASLDLATGVTATVAGQRAFALYLTKAATIAGTLVGAATGKTGGAGGFAGGEKNGATGASCSGGEGKGGGPGGGATDGDGGGGGGGFKAAGGAGADSDYGSDPKGGAGGAASSDETLVPLRGGCGGGAGGGPSTVGSFSGDGGYGGGGGGAIQIAVNGKLLVSGVINVPGAGGEGGHNGTAGGGGGSGGAMLLEGSSVEIAGTLAANGGGGGSGSKIYTEDAAPSGQDGQPSAQPAKGGPVNPTFGGAGGNGGAGATEAGASAPTEANAGGGGGAVGRIRINAPTLDHASGTLSPAHSSSSTVGKW